MAQKCSGYDGSNFPALREHIVKCRIQTIAESGNKTDMNFILSIPGVQKM